MVEVQEIGDTNVVVFRRGRGGGEREGGREGGERGREGERGRGGEREGRRAIELQQIT